MARRVKKSCPAALDDLIAKQRITYQKAKAARKGALRAPCGGALRDFGKFNRSAKRAADRGSYERAILDHGRAWLAESRYRACVLGKITRGR